VARFYAEGFAPWCEKARWALDHHRVPYVEIEHVPLLGELALRRAARRPLGRVTVPLFVDRGEVLMDSFAIARHAEGVGTGPSLFPAGSEADVAAWNERSEVLMRSGRAMLLPRLRRDRAALLEQLPPAVPSVLRPVLLPLSAFGAEHLMRKYAIRAGEEARHEAASRESLDTLRGALAAGRGCVLPGGFSYADVAMAAALQFLRPVDERYIRLGPATREVWTHPGLATAYADLLAWRDELYARHRRGGERQTAR
jgi:glutathione S-transferase